MQAIIMAAGMGTRLGNMTKEVPKALIPVCGVPLLGWQLKSLLKLKEISEIIVVMGYLGEMVEKYVLQEFNDKRITLIYNSEYKKGPIITVYQAKKMIHEDFLVLNVDHLFPSKAYHKVAHETKTILIGSFNNRQPYDDERKIVLHENGKVQLIKKTDSYCCGYTGLVAVGKRYAQSYFSAALDEINKGNDFYHPDDLIFPLSEKGIPMQIFDLSEYTFLEVDTPEDYILAEKEISKIEKEDSL